jgi:hypothetical protein
MQAHLARIPSGIFRHDALPVVSRLRAEFSESEARGPVSLVRHRGKWRGAVGGKEHTLPGAEMRQRRALVSRVLQPAVHDQTSRGDSSARR